MPKHGHWTGCKHNVKPLIWCSDMDCTLELFHGKYQDFKEDNPNDLCYECWLKEREGKK